MNTIIAAAGIGALVAFVIAAVLCGVAFFFIHRFIRDCEEDRRRDGRRFAATMTNGVQIQAHGVDSLFDAIADDARNMDETMLNKVYAAAGRVSFAVQTELAARGLD